MVQDFMDVLNKQTALAPQARVYVPAPDTLPEGPIRVLAIKPGHAGGAYREAGEKFVLQNGAKEFARVLTRDGKPRLVVVEGKEYKTRFEQDWMVFLEDLSAPKQAADHAGGGQGNNGGKAPI